MPDMRNLTLFLAHLYASWSCLTWGIWRYFSLIYMHPDRAWHEVSDVVSVLAICFLALSDMRYLTFPSQPYASWPCLTWGVWHFLLSYMLPGLVLHEVSDVVSLSAICFLAVPDMKHLTLFLSRLPVLLDRAWHEVSDVVSISAICFLIVPDMRYLTLFVSQLPGRSARVWLETPGETELPDNSLWWGGQHPCLLGLFHAQLSLERDWRRPRSQEVDRWRCCT